MRVRSILDACGGPLALDTSRVRSQVGMRFWYEVSMILRFVRCELSNSTYTRWDATLALVSRQGTFIDQSYLEHLVLSKGQDEWSFYDLIGCPGDLFVHLAHLAELAKQREIAACMTWLSFDMSLERDFKTGGALCSPTAILRAPTPSWQAHQTPTLTQTQESTSMPGRTATTAPKRGGTPS